MKLLLGVCAFVVSSFVLNAMGQAYPSRPITLIVPYSAGGPADTLARILGDRMRNAIGQSIVIDNIGGAAGTIAVGRAARAAPDGYTIVIGNWSTHVLNGAIYDLQYDLLQDFEPVAMTTTNPQLIVTNNGVPAKDLKELIAWIKGNETKVSAGTAGVGSSSHVSGVYFQKLTGTKFEFVPYRGGAQILQDLIAGHINLVFDQASNSLPYVRSGKVKAYAVAANKRLSAAADIPTVDEAGLPGLYVAVWFGIWAPKDTPKNIIAKLNDAIRESLNDTNVQKRLKDLGQEVVPRDQQSPEALAAFHRAEIEKWWPVIKAAGIRATE